LSTAYTGDDEAVRGKLREAIADIQRLVQEREQLMRISNGLRAQLNRFGPDASGSQAAEEPPSVPGTVAAEPAADIAARSLRQSTVSSIGSENIRNLFRMVDVEEEETDPEEVSSELTHEASVASEAVEPRRGLTDGTGDGTLRLKGQPIDYSVRPPVASVSSRTTEGQAEARGRMRHEKGTKPPRNYAIKSPHPTGVE